MNRVNIEDIDHDLYEVRQIFPALLPNELNAGRRKFDMISIIFWVLNFVLVTIFVCTLWSRVEANQIAWTDLMWLLGAMIAVVPIHELIHGMVYRILGASVANIKFEHSHFIFFYTYAHRFALTLWEWAFVAMVPFCAVLLVGFGAMATFPGQLLLITGILAWHNSIAKDDIDIMRFAWRNKGQGTIVYDDHGIGCMYMLRPKQNY